MEEFMTHLDHPVSRELARRAISTCLGPDTNVATPKIQEAYMSSSRNDSWSLIIQADCAVPSDEKDPQLVCLQAKGELDEDGNVEFIPLVPHTTKARAKYDIIFDQEDSVTDPESPSRSTHNRVEDSNVVAAMQDAVN